MLVFLVWSFVLVCYFPDHPVAASIVCAAATYGIAWGVLAVQGVTPGEIQ